ncbi:MAG: hypothetical protein A3A94_02720 [Candidatus Portnoybacteria bacterium RIFCSPLOWO2_01_FULL_43_11]|uniref:ParB-like N-terminal domain-containing protein n=4 Tax=Candidatus Portnoyibacteriota TaxID=1817913 RepID=A0A1G2FB64_9BACT|nr:MAG: hypothetical protein A2815_01220 [Candidatus Portnoybacteria bacterium RIFCSPHIGHO2_01_FULL_40_12b]OGZ36920.1 MAG: hypothetical protein A3D38_02390 [Candidatus Portnoybacteria bacterium RIFCSPHIGHO2_02_FULL_40_23]OGZ37588.1 MAG: hypothetical protein A3E90_00335 [Candidatus Portnoybacteria bacterium RIFCSPHIGHO2_12_FULL_40_11]OGZ38021.1 MAG: hypothetical protein A3A94_02720 [Candidatus Portnoybacteria bacterium RIFCSPLOWO2_01_FULL_43_11]OGZ39794.1 MAG: hypothetical protein A3I20_00850 [C
MKGLQSLIPKKSSRLTVLIKKQSRKKNLFGSKKESVFNIEVNKIKPNPHQPRRDFSEDSLKELADSIGEHGVLQPLLVTKIEKPTARGRRVEYQLVAGERRLEAAKIAGLPRVPVIIRDNSERQKLEIALVENIQREDLNPIEAALAFKQLNDDFGLKHEEIAKKVGKSRVAVTNCLRLLNLPLRVQEAITKGKISFGHGKALLMAKPEKQKDLFGDIIKDNLTVHETEYRAQRVAARPSDKESKNPLFQKIEKDLQEVLGNRVSVTKRGRAGRLTLQFYSDEELDKIVNRLLKI